MRRLGAITWPEGGPACALWALSAASRHAARLAWQLALRTELEAPGLQIEPVLRDGTRSGWRWHSGSGPAWALRVAYGQWPPDVAPPPGTPLQVVALAWQPEHLAEEWALDCAPAAALPEAEAVLRLYGGQALPGLPPPLAFGHAWARLEASAKLAGGLAEGVTPPVPAQLHSQALGAWVLAWAQR